MVSEVWPRSWKEAEPTPCRTGSFWSQREKFHQKLTRSKNISGSKPLPVPEQKSADDWTPRCGLYRFVVICTGPYWSGLIHSGQYQSVLVHSGLYWSVLVHSEGYWSTRNSQNQNLWIQLMTFLLKREVHIWERLLLRKPKHFILTLVPLQNQLGQFKARVTRDAVTMEDFTVRSCERFVKMPKEMIWKIKASIRPKCLDVLRKENERVNRSLKGGNSD